MAVSSFSANDVGARLPGTRACLTGDGPTAATNSLGQFELHTTNEPGALVGAHHVTVIKQEISGLVDGLPGPGGLKTNWFTPPRNSRPDTSGLTNVMNKGRNTFEFPLSSE